MTADDHGAGVAGGPARPAGPAGPVPGTRDAFGPGLPAAFYDRPVVEVARELLGCVLVHGETAGRIVETEAYHQTEGACHAWRPPPKEPRPTARTAELFGPPGRAYVYRSYGIHTMLNAVCEPEGVAAAVLIRAVEPVAGVETMRDRRAGRPDRELTAGPGRLTLALDIRMEHDGADLTASPLRILPPRLADREPRVVTGPRIGITRAVDLSWRFVDETSTDVSRPWPPEMRRGGRA
ncbi:DNA-3-methyladenine glycosylase [Patulibacter sp. NPDC049589]|uniref:DNA-3-methyladenine glycosylase n=1 Tax=Patulibacter sp. NPDC049589 TaxID=3154731 RepID=UPI00343B5E68